MSNGRFITLEGIEGAGKSSVARLLHDSLARRGIRAILTREPGGTPLAERVRQIVLERQGENVTPAAETLLMFAARAIHLDNLIRPALARGEWVICDRFTDATRAYQGAGRGMNADWIEHLAREVHRGLEPDRTLLLDLPVETGLARARQRSGAAAMDRFEAESVQFFERVRAGYHSLARSAPQRFRVVDASQPLQEVERQAIAALADLMP